MAKVAFPARCAVAVVCGGHLVSQVYPASVPVEVFIDNIVELLNDELKRRGLTGLESGVGYELHKANGVRLDVTKTLDELGVEDGATLVLVPAAEGDKPGFRDNLRGHGMTPTEDPEVLWNFEKFLVSRDGEVVARFAPNVTPDDELITSAIERELQGS